MEDLIPVLTEVIETSDDIKPNLLADIKEKYRPGNLVVISMDRFLELPQEEVEWLSTNVAGNLLLFPNDTLTNVAIVKT